MLLSVEPFTHATEGTLLDLWFVGGNHKVVRPPCQPHFYSWIERGVCEPVRKRLMGDPSRQLQDIFRVDFDTGDPSRQLQDIFRVDFDTLRDLEFSRHSESFEDHKRFVDVLISEYGFAIDSPLPSVLAWDIETFTKNRVGTDWRNDTIRSIAVWGFLEEIRSCVLFGTRKTCKGCSWNDTGACMFEFDANGKPTGLFGRCWRVSAQDAEPDVIRKALRFKNTFDPDVLAGFNDGDYDFRVLLTRCNWHRIVCSLGRDGSVPYVLVKNYQRRGKERETCLVRVHGRVHLDVYLEVLFDQTLYDLKGRGQLEVAKHFGFDPIEGIDHANIPEDRLEEVNIDDARCCFELAQLYLKNIYAMCEEQKVPLNLMCARSPSHQPNWFYGQAYAELGIVSDKTNCERFPQIFGRGGKPYQGALVKCFKTGIFFDVKHKDFASMYPSLMMEYNLSPETVTLVAIKPYTGEYRFEKYDDYWIIEVPDVPKKKGKPDWKVAAQIICRVDMSEDSVTKKKLIWIREERFRLKKEYKRTKDEKLYSRQYALKVIQNKLYGYNGMKWALYGNILVAILITALGRYHMSAEINKPEYGKPVVVEGVRAGERIIEVDTDGFYYD